MLTQEEKQWAMFAHIGSAVFGIIGALIVYFMKKDESKFIAYHATQALYLQCGIAALVLISIVLFAITLGLAGIILFPLVMLVSIGALVFHIIGAIKANEGEWYKLPVVSKYTEKLLP